MPGAESVPGPAAPPAQRSPRGAHRARPRKARLRLLVLQEDGEAAVDRGQDALNLPGSHSERKGIGIRVW